MISVKKPQPHSAPRPNQGQCGPSGRPPLLPLSSLPSSASSNLSAPSGGMPQGSEHKAKTADAARTGGAPGHGCTGTRSTRLGAFKGQAQGQAPGKGQAERKEQGRAQGQAHGEEQAQKQGSGPAGAKAACVGPASSTAETRGPTPAALLLTPASLCASTPTPTPSGGAPREAEAAPRSGLCTHSNRTGYPHGAPLDAHTVAALGGRLSLEERRKVERSVARHNRQLSRLRRDAEEKEKAQLQREVQEAAEGAVLRMREGQGAGSGVEQQQQQQHQLCCKQDEPKGAKASMQRKMQLQVGAEQHGVGGNQGGKGQGVQEQEEAHRSGQGVEANEEAGEASEADGGRAEMVQECVVRECGAVLERECGLAKQHAAHFWNKEDPVLTSIATTRVFAQLEADCILLHSNINAALLRLTTAAQALLTLQASTRFYRCNLMAAHNSESALPSWMGIHL